MTYQTLTITKQEAAYIASEYPTLAAVEKVLDQMWASKYEYIVNLNSTESNQENLNRINQLLNEKWNRENPDATV